MSFKLIFAATLLVFSIGIRADAEDVARINREVAAYKHGKAIDNAIYEGRVIPGMNEEQVVRAKGYPVRRNDNGGNIQLVYPNGTGGHDYVYLRKGLTY